MIINTKKLIQSMSPIIFVAILAACGQKAPVFANNSAPDSSFSVSMPGTPRIQEISAPASAPNALGSGQAYFGNANNVSYAVMTIDMKELKYGLLSDNLDMIRDNFVQTEHGTLMSEQTIRIAGTTGRELVVKSSTGLIGHYRFCIINKRIYVAGITFSSGATDDSNAADAWLNGFHIRES